MGLQRVLFIVFLISPFATMATAMALHSELGFQIETEDPLIEFKQIKKEVRIKGWITLEYEISMLSPFEREELIRRLEEEDFAAAFFDEITEEIEWKDYPYVFDIIDDDVVLMHAYFKKSLSETDDEINISYTLAEEEPLTHNGKFAKKTLEDEIYRILIDTSEADRLGLKIEVYLQSLHPSKIARMTGLYSLKAFYADIEENWIKIPDELDEVLQEVLTSNWGPGRVFVSN